MGRHWVRSLLLSFAMLSATGAAGWTKTADDAVDQTAMAIPRIGMPGARDVALPQPLSPADAARIRRIFALQRGGSISEATREMGQLDSDMLRGAILADRYLGTAAIVDAPELSDWLGRFSDLPDAPAIRALLEGLVQREGQSRVSAKPARKALSGVPARALLARNEDREATDTAQSLIASGSEGARDAESLFAGGVAAWRLNEIGFARPLFEAAWRVSDDASLRAAAAYWAARVAEHAHDRGGRLVWLRRANQERNTFYGPIARRALSPVLACLPPHPSNKLVVTNVDVDALMSTAPGRRGLALLQVGENARAEAELRGLWLDSGARPALGRSLILVAKAVGLSRLADELRRDTEAVESNFGKFEVPLLRPAGGFRMDPAFVYAVVRHESNFQPLAVSPVGARGLMQLMPATAVGMGGIGDGQTDRLNDPPTNLALGQRYLLQLVNHPLVGDDLLKVIAAYGQGPTGMNRWAEGVRHNGDPFVFLEAMPSAFMRQFIEDVLIFQWQYAAALRLRAGSLDDLAAGIYPKFTPIKAAPAGIRARPETCPEWKG